MRNYQGFESLTRLHFPVIVRRCLIMEERILVVDDERVVREGLKMALEAAGYRVSLARNGEECLSRFADVRPHLVILDIMMPKMDGFETCIELRRRDSQVPIVFLTGKDAAADEVHALSIGADDFVSKGDDPVVLLARIRRALNRAAEFDSSVPPVFTLGKVTVDLSRPVVIDGARTVRLTRTQADILRLLMSAPGHVLSKDEMLESLRGVGYSCTDGVVYTHIYKLRERLGRAASCLDCKNSVGYRLIV